MSDLRTRIADAIYEQRRSVSRVPMLAGWAGAHPTVQEMWLATADAVIAELNPYFNDSYDDGYNDGYNSGYNDGKADDDE